MTQRQSKLTTQFFFSKIFGMPSGPVEVVALRHRRVLKTIFGVKVTCEKVELLTRESKSGQTPSSAIKTLLKIV